MWTVTATIEAVEGGHCGRFCINPQCPRQRVRGARPSYQGSGSMHQYPAI